MSKIAYELFNLPDADVSKLGSPSKMLCIAPTIKMSKKVKDSEFIIPTKETIHLFDKYNCSLSQLKKTAKYYNIKLTGSKDTLKKRIINYFSIPKWVIIIQKFTRGYIQRSYNLLHGPAYKNRTLCTNNSDFLTLDQLDELNIHQFFSFKDDNGFIYGYDIASLFNLFKQNDFMNVENPYNREMFPDTIFQSICEIIKKGKLLGVNITLNIEPETDNLSDEKIIELRSLDLFQYINSLGNYSSNEWFLSLDRFRLIRFFRELLDIWNYRTQISPHVKRLICPPNGDPFYDLTVSTIAHEEDILQIKYYILKVMERMVYSSSTDDFKNIGAMYVLGGLTIVNSDASDAIPWLYQSFV